MPAVQIQPTPNPNALKFVLPDHRFARPQNFPTAEAGAVEPLAAQLFALGGIYNVFFAQDFVTVNKYPDADWEPLRADVAKLLAKYFYKNNSTERTEQAQRTTERGD